MAASAAANAARRSSAPQANAGGSGHAAAATAPATAGVAAAASLKPGTRARKRRTAASWIGSNRRTSPPRLPGSTASNGASGGIPWRARKAAASGGGPSGSAAGWPTWTHFSPARAKNGGSNGSRARTRS